MSTTPQPEHALYVPYVSGAVWVVRHAHTVVARHASRREAIEDALRRVAASGAGTSGTSMQVRVQDDDGSWHVLGDDESAADGNTADAR